MDILNKNSNIKVVAKFFEIKQSGEKQEKIVVLSKSNTCICCGARNNRLIKLNKCSHKEFLECYFKNRINVTMTVVCHYCHGILKKIDDFKKQIEKCLTDRQMVLYPKPKLTKLRKPIFVEIKPQNTGKNKDDIPPITLIEIPYKGQDINFKKEPSESCKEETNMDMDFEMDIGGTVIIAPGSDKSAVEFEIPHKANKVTTAQLPMNEVNALIKNVLPAYQIGSKNDEKRDARNVGLSKGDIIVQNSEPILKQLKAVEISRTMISNPIEPNKGINKQQPIDECLYGKVQIVIQTYTEIEKERELLRKEDRYTSMPVKCEDCIVGFAHEDGLVRHKVKKHDASQGGHVCKVCKSVYSSEERLQAHEINHWKRYQCVPCGQRFKMLCNCITHYNEEHGANGQAIDQIFECRDEDCSFTCSDYLEYKRHRRVHNKKWDCKDCGNSFASSYNLKNHIQTVHDKKRREYKCKDCGKEYRTKTGLTFHWRSLHDRSEFVPPLQCPVCARRFKNKVMFDKHCRRHGEKNEEKRFICDICGEKFHYKDGIVNHIDRVHLKTEHKCKECNKVFLNYRILRKHERQKHNPGQKPAPNTLCDLCGKEFKSSLILKGHMTTHTGERPYKCCFCSATFGFSAALYTHKKLVHKQPKKKQEVK